MMKAAILGTALTLGLATSAQALTVKNTSANEIYIGLDQGDKESVHKIGAGKSVTFKNECDNHCGVTGPWNFSWWAKTGDSIETDGTSMTSGKATSG